MQTDPPEQPPAAVGAAASAAEPDDPAFEAKVLRAFIRGDRLASIPARERKKRVIYRFLLERVLPDDARVDERELNMRLALWHPDVAMIRRGLVDLKLAERTGMTYRRAAPTADRAAGD